MEDEKARIETCLQDEPAYCTAACPFHMDVRDFAEKLQRGSFNAAFKTFRNAVGFPEIVAELCQQPCQAVCPRNDMDAPVALRLLERATIRHARNIDPTDYNVPPKHKRVAVIGAGVSGLACALRMAAKKYEVTIYERSGRIGGHLWELLSPDLFLADIERQFKYENYTLLLETSIGSLDDLDYDAIYVATGRGGDDFGLIQDINEHSFASTRAGVFLGGSLLGADSIEAIAHGLHVVNPIERYIKVGSMEHPMEDHRTAMHLDPRALTFIPPVVPSDGIAFTRDEAKAEARRCLRCACDACQRHCDLMMYYKKYPKRIRDDAQMPANMEGTGCLATRLIASCDQCGLCKEICPKGIDMGRFLLESRQAMHRKDQMPWAFHDFWLRDMAFTNSEKAHLSRSPLGYSQCRYVFFPGCQLGASDPQYVLKSYQWLLSKNVDTALMLSCCGVPALWSGDEAYHLEAIAKLREDWISLGKPKAIFACPSCKRTFKDFLPEIEGLFLYDFMLELGITTAAPVTGELASVFDPCSSREEPRLQKAIRELSETAGFRLQSLPYEARLAQCCSWGGHVSIANPVHVQQVVERRINHNDNPYITYCVNCRDIFASAGKPCYHILDILLGVHDSAYEPPTITERRRNRTRLKRDMLLKYWNEEAEAEIVESKIKLIIPPGIRQKLDDEMILETDILSVVEHCESSGNKISNSDTGNIMGHLQVGRMTYWVEYRHVGHGIELVNAYGHRMSIVED